MPLPKIESAEVPSPSESGDSIGYTSSGNAVKKGNSNNGVQTLADTISGGNSAEVSPNNSNILQNEFDQSQAETSQQAKETRKTIIKQSNQNEELIEDVDDSVKDSGNDIKKATEENKNTIEDVAKKQENDAIQDENKQNIKDEQNERKNDDSIRKAESQRQTIVEHLATIISLFKNNNNVKGATGSDKGLAGNFFNGLAGSLGGLIIGAISKGIIKGLVRGLPTLGRSMLTLVGRGISTLARFASLPLVKATGILVAKATAVAAAGAALGYLLVKTYDMMAGTNYADEGVKGAKGFLTEGTITPELKRIQEAEVKQDEHATEANKKTKSTRDKMSVAAVNIKETEKKYKEVPSSNILTDTGSFQDIEKRKEALQDANDILLQFKEFIISNKENTKTPAGLNSVSTSMVEFVKDTYPVYETIMLRAGFDPQKDAPQGLENYASLYTQIQKSIKEGKAYPFKNKGGLETRVAPQIQQMIQVASTESEKNWSAMGLGSLEKREGITESDIKNEQNASARQSTTSTEKVSAKPQDQQIPDSGPKSENQVTTNNVVVSGKSPNPSALGSAATPEGGASRAAVDTNADADIIAYAIGKQTQYATFPAIA